MQVPERTEGGEAPRWPGATASAYFTEERRSQQVGHLIVLLLIAGITVWAAGRGWWKTVPCPPPSTQPQQDLAEGASQTDEVFPPAGPGRHKSGAGVVIGVVSAHTEAAMPAGDVADSFDFEAVFHAHYRRVARVIVRIIQDPSRAEELAVEVFWKLWRHPSAQGPHSAAWLYRAAARTAVDELRARARRERRERWFGSRAPSGDPELAREAGEERTRVRTVLAALRPQDAQLIALRSEGFSYDELAQTLTINPSSIGTMLRRAHDMFRREYVKRYGHQ